MSACINWKGDFSEVESDSAAPLPIRFAESARVTCRESPVLLDHDFFSSAIPNRPS